MADERIRQPTVDDADVMGRVHVRAWQAAYRGVMPEEYLDGLRAEDRAGMWRRQISSAEGAVGLWVVEVDDAVVGFVAFGPERAPDLLNTPGRGEVYAINLDPDSWGKGTGRRLLQAATRALEERGYPELVLWVVPENVRARALYESEGWTADGATKVDNLLGVTVSEVRYVRRVGLVGRRS
ncbi:MAG: GNAT family N-acetyltransferase [Acidimicrobiales bacterium]